MSLIVTELLLLLTAGALALKSRKTMMGITLACLVIGATALIGAMKFAGLSTLAPLHKLLSMLSSCMALPLLAACVIWPEGSVSRTLRYSTIFSFIAAFLGILLVTLEEIELWRLLCVLASIVSIISVSLIRWNLSAFAAGLCFLAGFTAFNLKWHIGILLPGDLLHLGLATALLFLMATIGKNSASN